ncbi:MAG: Cys-Gln thioester bond-forming surface protein [Firmicutes bacterium]|nr:Cys-Gln thioester bond-forming surface protein [Bacillota bacterium]
MKRTKKMTSILLTAALITSMAISPAMAETIDNGDGTTTEITVTTDGTAENGYTITTATVYDAEGNVISTNVKKVETETTVTEDTGNGQQPEVTVTVTPGAEGGSVEVTEFATVTGASAGDLPEGEDDTEYNYTETTTAERAVTAEITKSEAETIETEGEKISASETDKEGILNEEHEVLGGQDEFYERLRDGDYLVVQAGQGNFNGTNSGNIQYYMLDANGNVKLDKSGNPVPLNGKRGDDIYQILLKDKDGNFHTVYGLKNGISTEGLSYNEKDLQAYIGNLAYGEDSITALNCIAEHGYWGTDSGLGSLKKMQSEMKAAVKETEDGKYSIGGVTFDSREAAESAIDALNDGDAQLVTNAAIWSFTDGYAGQEKVNNTNSGFGNYCFGNFVADGTDVATLQMMYQYLMEAVNTGIEQSKVPAVEGNATEETETYVEEVSMKVYDKVSDVESNKDDDKDNDIYSTDLSIKMVVTKDGTLRVYSNGVEIASADISSSNGESTTVTFEGLVLAENEKVDIKLEHVEYMNTGVYVLEPTQSAYDQYGAYGPMSPLVGLKTDTVKTTTSYSFEFDVDENDKTVVKRSTCTTTFNQNEDVPGTGDIPTGVLGEIGKMDEVSVDNEDVPLAGAENLEEIEDADVPLTALPEENIPLTEAEDFEEIEKSEAPLSAVPKTGDTSNSLLWIMAALLSALLMAAMTMADRKARQ